MNNEDQFDLSKSNNESNTGKCEVIAEESNAVGAGTELTVASSNNLTTGASNTGCSSFELDSNRGTYDSSEMDDTITDEDIALFFEDRPYSSNIPASCTHFYCVQPVPKSGINIKAPCIECSSTDENWICLTCYQVYCSRYVNKHMVAHTQETNHVITLSLSDVSVWCYSCDDYVYNEVLEKATKIVLDAKYGSPTDILTMSAMSKAD